MSEYKNIDISALDLNMLFITSFRYAITRRTYVTSIISDLIRRNKCALNKNTLKLFIREIEEELERLDGYLDDCDRNMWLSLSEDLSEYLKEN